MAVLTCSPGQVTAFVAARQSLTRWRPMAGAETAAQAVERIGPISAEDPTTPFLSLAARLEGFEPAHLLTAWQGDGSVVKRPVLGNRPHLIPRRRAAALSRVDSERDAIREAFKATGLTEEQRRSLTELIKNTLRTNGSVALSDLPALLPSEVPVDLAEDTEVTRALLARWWHHGDLERGVQVTDWRRDALRIGAPPDETVTVPDEDTARAEIASWYLHAYGPATPRDLAAWAGWPLRQTRRAIDALDREVTQVAVTGWDSENALVLSEDADTLDEAADGLEGHSVALLPAADPLLAAYRETRHRLDGDPAATRRVLGRGRPHAAVLVQGRIEGTWSWDARDAEQLTVDVADGIDHDAVVEAAQRVAAAIGAREVVTTTEEEE